MKNRWTVLRSWHRLGGFSTVSSRRQPAATALADTHLLNTGPIAKEARGIDDRFSVVWGVGRRPTSGHEKPLDRFTLVAQVGRFFNGVKPASAGRNSPC